MFEKYALFRAMKKLFANPVKKFSVRGLAAETGLSSSAAKACLDYLFSEKMLFLEKVGRTYQYSVDLSSVLVRQWKILFSLNELGESRVVEKILGESENVVSITLYGSLAKGSSDAKSDVDLLVVTHDKQKTNFGLGLTASGREINLLVETPSSWRMLANKNKVFYEQVVLDGVQLFGPKPIVL